MLSVQTLENLSFVFISPNTTFELSLTPISHRLKFIETVNTIIPTTYPCKIANLNHTNSAPPQM